MTALRPAARHSIRRLLVGGVALLVVLAAIASAATIAIVSVSTERFASVTDRFSALMDAQTDLALAASATAAEVRELLLNGGNGDLAAYEAARHAETHAQDTLNDLAAGDGGLVILVEAVRARTDGYGAWADVAIEALRTGGGPSAADAADGEHLATEVQDAIGNLDAGLVARREVSRRELDVGSLGVTLYLVIVSAGAAILPLAVGFWLIRRISAPLRRLNRTAAALVAGESVIFRAERDDEIGALAGVLEQLRVGVEERFVAARGEAKRAATLNQLGDLMSFATNEEELVTAAVHAIRRLADSPRGDVMLVNNSTNRLMVAAAWGTDPPAVGAPVDIERTDRCPGIRRASAYVAGDVADEMTVRCPAHRAASGSVACVPMTALGQAVGVIHLERADVNAFDPETIRLAARIAEQVALAAANARLMRTMEGLAMTDALTGLRNARFFDPYLEQELAASVRDQLPLGLVVVDIDHFKQFNDTHGHPAGDEALRAFARVLRSTIRTSDVVARYGGEEFVIALRHAGLEESRMVAEKIRAAVERNVVEIGPGRYARITASFGVVATDVHKVDQKGLMALADAALYRAKEAGRNRVEIAPSSESDLGAAARRRAGRAPDARPATLPSSETT
jgi:diguanylate cyclase (GGDEF)-like protein